MAGNTSKIVIAELDDFNYRERCGFAVADGQRYFIQQKTCREVGGTLNQPVLTSQRCNELPQFWSAEIFDFPPLILNVEQGTGRRRAVAWGILPQRNWLDDLQYRRTLNQYVGGEVEIAYLWRGQVHTEVHGRLLTPPQLVPGNPWQLSLTYFSTHGVQAITGCVTATFDLKGARPDFSRCNTQQYGLSMPGATHNDWIGITLIKNAC